jgi:hypothetical protein
MANPISAQAAPSSEAPPTLVNWIEGRDGLDDLARVRWFGHIMRGWRRISREVYRMNAPR